MKICASLVGQGFRKIFILPSYRGISQITEMFCRDFYESTHIHPICISTMEIIQPPVEERPDGRYNDYIELTACGAYRIMQMEHLIPLYPDAERDSCERKEVEPEVSALMNQVRKIGSGMCQLYMDPNEHNGGFYFKTEADRDEVCQRGERVIRNAVDKLELDGLMKALDDYHAYTKRVCEKYPRLDHLG